MGIKPAVFLYEQGVKGIFYSVNPNTIGIKRNDITYSIICVKGSVSINPDTT